MLLFLIIMSWTFSMIFVFLNHPLSFGLILLLQTITTAMSCSILNFDSWFSYILFLIMIGGMLVLFIYMTSVASDEKFKFSNKIFCMFSFIWLVLSLTLMFSDNFLSMMDTFYYDLINQSMYNIDLSKNKYMNYPSVLIIMLMILYLLITLIAIVKITKFKAGPLRQN
uniref:NADH-ubiquinone oxidoreductase chain 6 n=1 Tax=Sitona obsoletus TaxID=1541163 RepID=A0A411LWR5_9CUCU|nr:NADH dehydrogenase subunit 6 [Sitona obsoletus]QBF03817.1 NADH dehydrogenase subunit 6 [Sitona obsoletus]